MKRALRDHWISIRSQIQKSRREETQSKLFKELTQQTENFRSVLSFFSFRNEISMDEFNDYLAKNGKLCLPKIHEEHLDLYRVEEVDHQCVPNAWGIVEPDPALCEKIVEDEIFLAFIPGIAFDSQYHRLGYGKGFYDRLLARLNDSTLTYGIGFKEQYSQTLLPIEAHDISLNRLLLF